MELAWSYLLAAVVGLLLARASRRGVLSPVSAWVLLAVGVLGFVNLFLFDRLNIMVNYEVMLRRWGK